MALPDDYVLPEDDESLLAQCDVTVFQASGPGGQHRNRKLTAVRLFHEPSGLVVIGRRQRSQRRNRTDALVRLRRRLEDILTIPVDRVPTKPTRKARRRRAAAKRHRAEIKRTRGRVRGDDG